MSQLNLRTAIEGWVAETLDVHSDGEPIEWVTGVTALPNENGGSVAFIVVSFAIPAIERDDHLFTHFVIPTFGITADLVREHTKASLQELRDLKVEQTVNVGVAQRAAERGDTEANTSSTSDGGVPPETAVRE